MTQTLNTLVGYCVNYVMGGGGVLGPKIAGGVPWATQNWTQKDRGENGILGPKKI